jgi:phosphomannomutase
MASPAMIQLLRDVRKKAVIGFVGGSDLAKITEQLAVSGSDGWYTSNTQFVRIELTMLPLVIQDFDYAFAENGLTAYKLGVQLPSQSFINYVGEERYKTLVNFILHYIADLDIPIKRLVSCCFLIAAVSHESTTVERLSSSGMV